MSESKSKLEQVLEFLLAEDNDRAEELLHEYVVETARKEYERILDDAEVSIDETAVDSKEESEEAVEETAETEEEAVEEEINQADPEADFVADVEEADADIESDEIGEEMEDGEIEDKVDELESELEDLRAEFEKLLDKEGDDEEGMDGEEAEMDAEMDMEPEMDDMEMEPEMEEESVEYDLDEEVVDEDDDVVEEATKLSDNVAEPKGGDADNNDSGTAKKGVTKVVSPNGQGTPVKTNDGGDGDSGNNSPKDSGASSNLNVEPKKV